MIKLFKKIFRVMWKINSCISTILSLGNGTFHKRYARKQVHKVSNKINRSLFK